jgi:transcriptional regulator with XRE-family HTH domain
MFLGERLRTLREKRKLTQKAVDDGAGLARSYMARIESGQVVPTIETLTKIAVVLRVPLYQFFVERGIRKQG